MSDNKPVDSSDNYAHRRHLSPLVLTVVNIVELLILEPASLFETPWIRQKLLSPLYTRVELSVRLCFLYYRLLTLI